MNSKMKTILGFIIRSGSYESSKLPFFLYGTLRPDTPEDTVWNKMWKSGFSPSFQKAYLKQSSLYQGDFPFIIVEDDVNEEDDCEDDEESWRDHVVFGYLQNVESNIYEKAVEYLDWVESTPEIYKRIEYTAHLCEDFDEIDGSEKRVKCYVYIFESDLYGNSIHLHHGDFIRYLKDLEDEKDDDEL